MPRLDRGIQYAAASLLSHDRLGVLGRPVKPGDDIEGEVHPATARLHVSNSGHAFAISRRVPPESCVGTLPSLRQGRSEDRAPAGTRRSVAIEMHTGWITGSPDRPAFPARWF